MAGKKSKIVGNLLMGIRFSSLMKMIFRNSVSLKPVYLLRLIVLIPTSLLSELFSVIEKIKFGRLIRSTNIIENPVFIIGHWRTGTTFLHQLISLDKQFTSPKVIQTVIPDHFLISTKYWVPILKKMMPPKRPMDEVEMGPLDPMEDEWALLRLNAPGPFQKIFFPSEKRGYFSNPGEFNPEGKELEEWKRKFTTFLAKVTLSDPRQIVLKNPFHTPRVSILSGMFPGAKFIHIVRHPYKTVPSTINMWNIVAGENAFRMGWKTPSVEESAGLVDMFWKSVKGSRDILKPGQFTEIRYEDLEKDPVSEIRRLYSELDIIFTPELEQSILGFMDEKKSYRKNIFTLREDQKASINRILGDFMTAYRYEFH